MSRDARPAIALFSRCSSGLHGREQFASLVDKTGAPPTRGQRLFRRGPREYLLLHRRGHEVSDVRRTGMQRSPELLRRIPPAVNRRRQRAWYAGREERVGVGNS